MLDLIASSRATRVEHTPTCVLGKSVRVSFGGRVFARSGLGFVWASRQHQAGSAPSLHGKFSVSDRR
ncbi:Protein of unknown function [Mycobacterium canettii CIPT 140070017]|nr:Protein of unknown function [Mycobacterium canettii CIPT 140070017]